MSGLPLSHPGWRRPVGSYAAQVTGDNVIRFPVSRADPVPLPPREQVATYRVRVDLDDAEPAIWRCLELASDLRLDRLHEVLQTAMGWTDSHLHHFLMGPEHDPAMNPFVTDFDEEEGDKGINERDVRLDQVLAKVGDRLFYEYDFGDSWDHTLRLEAVTPQVEGGPSARCVGGARACPPEDCGGVWGYHELLSGLADPGTADEDLRERLDWLGEGFDPDDFDVERADALVQLTVTGSMGALLPLDAEFEESLLDLARRTTWLPTSPLAGLVRDARLDEIGVPDVETRRRTVRPWLHLLELVGDEGQTLTGAGYLKPSVVSALAAELGVMEPWMGKANREEHTPPVARLRESSAAMGLVRKVKGRLVLTPAGREIAGDPDRMWDRLVTSLPLGKKDHERHAGVIALLALAAGLQPTEGVRRLGPAILADAGWRLSTGEMDEWAAHDSARPTLGVLETAGCYSWRGERVIDESARQLARAALTFAG